MKKMVCLFICVVFLFGLAAPAYAADLPSAWAQEEVDTAISLGLVPETLQSGYDLPITRAEFVSLIMRLREVWGDMGTTPEADLSAVTFNDTQDAGILLCAALGIVEGDGEGNFMPDDPLTREQAAKILYNACDRFAPWVTTEDNRITTAWRGIASYQLPHTWADGEDIHAWAREKINWCYRHNVMQGVGEERFDPSGAYTREQSILTVLRLYYVNGAAALSPIKNELDYYPVFADREMTTVSGWLDSAMGMHATETFEYVPANPDDGEAPHPLGGGVFVELTEGSAVVTDAFGETLYTFSCPTGCEWVGSANGLICLFNPDTNSLTFYTPDGTAVAGSSL